LGKIPIDSGGATIFECLPESVLLNADVAKNVFDRGKIATSDCGAKVLRSYQFRPSQNPPAKRSPAAINPPPDAGPDQPPPYTVEPILEVYGGGT
jgi:hypothetical protein